MPIERCARSAFAFAIIKRCEPPADARPGDGCWLFVRAQPLRHCGHPGNSAAIWCDSSAAVAGNCCASDCSGRCHRALHHRISGRQDSVCGHRVGRHSHFYPSAIGRRDCFRGICRRAARMALGCCVACRRSCAHVPQHESVYPRGGEHCARAIQQLGFEHRRRLARCVADVVYRGSSSCNDLHRRGAVGFVRGVAALLI